ncbi:hypothetical protein RN001_001774 [Aquatica leii]|uniref:Peptidase M12B domain-containing protein n=1 Tax=Aquatica leii TaxID=1421715 RepID=A0AAN7PGK4_9COLE|nr:hypothetical protein RN001_001774 [Aquatica leii]
MYNIKDDYEIVFFPEMFPLRKAFNENQQTVENNFDFTIFGRSVSLKLKPNNKLISPSFKVHFQDENEDTVLTEKMSQTCHYLHKDLLSVAAISICQPKSVQGILLLENSTFEIHPLTPRIRTMLNLRETVTAEPNKYPHLIRKIVLDPSTSYYTFFSSSDNVVIRQMDLDSGFVENTAVDNAITTPISLTVELALFFDAEGYSIFAPYFNHDDDKLIEMLLIYINSVQALYHHISIGTALDLVLVRLDIMKTQPSKMPHYDGEQSKLLDSFCSYQSSLNSESDNDVNHWDMALYVSGLDFFADENGAKNEVTMGLAAVGGVCHSKYACVIAELGTVSILGKPYPSAGFTSVYVLAHEIGHNLGMHHDGSKNNCPKEGFIMSHSRGNFGEAQWSICSAQVMSRLKNKKCLHDLPGTPNTRFDHSRFKDVPGQVYVAKKQCEVLLKDKDALVSPSQKLADICYSLECKTSHHSGTYFSGPALEGTRCGKDMYCTGGECVSSLELRNINKESIRNTEISSDTNRLSIDYTQIPDNAINLISKNSDDFFEILE